MSVQHVPLNEFILIRTLPSLHHSKHDGVNRSSKRVSRFIKHARLTVEGLFAADRAGMLTQHITAIRVLDDTHYVAGGCPCLEHSCALVDRVTLEVKRAVVRTTDTTHNMLCFGSVIVNASSFGTLTLNDINSDLRYEIKEYEMSKSSGGALIKFNCGRHMAMDTSMAYILTSKVGTLDDALIRFDLKDTDIYNLHKSLSKLKITAVYEGKPARGFCLSHKYAYVLNDFGITRYCKKTLKKKHFSIENLSEGKDIHQIAANDYQVYACSGKQVLLLSLRTPTLQVLDRSQAIAIDSEYYRSIQSHAVDGLHFAAVMYEHQFGVALFVGYGGKLSLACEYRGDDIGRPLSLMFDDQNYRLIVGKEDCKSLILKLTF